MDIGYLQVYTGKGKGKTTAAIGQAVRAAGHGWNVHIVQLMKGPPFPKYGELKILGGIKNISIDQYPVKHLMEEEDIREEDVDTIEEGIQAIENVVNKQTLDMLVIDEINTACHFGLAEPENLIDILDDRDESLDVVLTGRYAPDLFIQESDIATNFENIKHPHQDGEKPREGIEW